MTSTKLHESLTSGNHQKLNSLVGDWEGRTQTWFEPGEPVDDSPVSGSIRPLFDGRFVQHEYKGRFEGNEFEGIAIYGYHMKTGKFQCAWMDTFHMGTGIMFSEAVEKEAFYNVLGSYEASAEQPDERWGWRTQIEIVNENNIIITAFNIDPQGEETKESETIYTRKTSIDLSNAAP